MNKNLLIPFISLIMLMMGGCASFLDKFTTVEPTNHHTVCSQLKRELIFYKTDHNLNPQWSSSTKRAQLMQEYQKYQCDQKN